jgi:predicted  nucleic acid-binding Zn-ribbon protein
MHPDLERMMVLQKQDLEAKRLREALAAVPKRMAELAAKVKAVQGQRAVVLELLQKEELLRRQQESEVKDRQAKIAKVQKQLDQATSTVQVTAFEHEIGFARAEIAKLEDAELESMERTEGLEAQRLLADQAVADAEATHAREQERGVETTERDQEALARVEAERAATRGTIGEDALATYDRIARNKGTALSEALLQKCTACQMMLRPQHWNNLLDRSQNEVMMHCESCGRLLYYDPARDAPQRKAVPVESIAASIIRSQRS